MKKLFALTLALLLTLTLFCGCGGKTGTDSEQLPASSDASDAGSTNPSSDAASDSESTNPSSDAASDTAPSDTKSGSAAAQASSTKANATSSKAANNAIDMNSLKGKTVKLLMWRDLTAQEKAAVSKFEKNTSMKVQVTQTTWANYMTKLSSMVSTGDSPDVAIIPTQNSSQGCFPLGAATVFQPIDVTKQNLNDSFWDIDSMNRYKIKNRYFTFIAYNNWYDCNGIVMYNANMFQDAGITTPRELWKSNNWNWDTLKSTALELTKKGHIGYVNSLYSNLMQSQGVDYVTYDGTEFKSNVTSQEVVAAWTFNAEMVASGAQPAYGTQSSAFEQGLAGMIGTNLWAARKDGQYGALKFTIDCVPFPSPKGKAAIVPANVNLFGIAKGAKNPIGGGVFIREFLDSANNGKFSDVAINPAFEDVFNYCTGKESKKGYKYAIGVVGYTNLNGLLNFEKTLAQTASNQITTVLQQNKTLVDNAVKQVNSKIK